MGLNEGTLFHRPEQAGAFQVIGNDFRNIAPITDLIGFNADETGDRNRKRFHLALGDVDSEFRTHRQGNDERQHHHP